MFDGNCDQFGSSMVKISKKRTENFGASTMALASSLPQR